MGRLMCRGCDKPFPNDWCWDGREFDCWAEFPPRWALETSTTRMLWGQLRDLRRRVAELEERLNSV